MPPEAFSVKTEIGWIRTPNQQKKPTRTLAFRRLVVDSACAVPVVVRGTRRARGGPEVGRVGVGGVRGTLAREPEPNGAGQPARDKNRVTGVVEQGIGI